MEKTQLNMDTEYVIAYGRNEYGFTQEQVISALEMSATNPWALAERYQNERGKLVLPEGYLQLLVLDAGVAEAKIALDRFSYTLDLERAEKQ